MDNCCINIPSELHNKICGVIFGQAIGDALGLGAEFMSHKEVLKYYPQGLTLYNQIIQDYHRKRWKQGDWTDDTDMMLCIANAIIADKDIYLNSIAQNFKKWFNGSPMGIGRHTYNVLAISDYTDNPTKAAEIVWKLSGKKSAANGGIMRTSVVGLWKQNVSFYAEEVCRLTHTDSRCIGSCVILSELIHHFVWNGYELNFETIQEIARKFDERIVPYLLLAKRSDDIQGLALDDEMTMGYTLKTLSAAIWCLYHTESFQEGLLAVVNAGGDADTNAAVACSLLGAKYGFNSISPYYVDNLRRKSLLDKVTDDLLDILCQDIQIVC